MAIERRRYSVSGRVQGVGLRPFVFRLAQQLTLAGTVYNSAAGVEIEVEGDSPALDAFAQHLQTQAPAAAAITGLQVQHLPPQQNPGFHITSSHSVTDSIAPLPLPDRATCTNCLQ
jgi:hydrogenase maturation protein HypF